MVDFAPELGETTAPPTTNGSKGACRIVPPVPIGDLVDAVPGQPTPNSSVSILARAAASAITAKRQSRSPGRPGTTPRSAASAATTVAPTDASVPPPPAAPPEISSIELTHASGSKPILASVAATDVHTSAGDAEVDTFRSCVTSLTVGTSPRPCTSPRLATTSPAATEAAAAAAAVAFEFVGMPRWEPGNVTTLVEDPPACVAPAPPSRAVDIEAEPPALPQSPRATAAFGRPGGIGPITSAATGTAATDMGRSRAMTPPKGKADPTEVMQRKTFAEMMRKAKPEPSAPDEEPPSPSPVPKPPGVADGPGPGSPEGGIDERIATGSVKVGGSKDSVASSADPAATSPWAVLLSGRQHLRTIDVQRACNRFRELRGGDGVTLSDSMLSLEELADVLGAEGGGGLDVATVGPLFRHLTMDGHGGGTSRCDLRVLLVVMAGLTRAKAVDRMRFAALLLDEADTSRLTHEQLVLVLRANALLGTKVAPPDFTELDVRARSIIEEVAAKRVNVSDADSLWGISHDEFLGVVQQSPEEVLLSPEPRSRPCPKRLAGVTSPSGTSTASVTPTSLTGTVFTPTSMLAAMRPEPSGTSTTPADTIMGATNPTSLEFSGSSAGAPLAAPVVGSLTEAELPSAPSETSGTPTTLADAVMAATAAPLPKATATSTCQADAVMTSTIVPETAAEPACAAALAPSVREPVTESNDSGEDSGGEIKPRRLDMKRQMLDMHVLMHQQEVIQRTPSVSPRTKRTPRTPREVEKEGDEVVPPALTPRPTMAAAACIQPPPVPPDVGSTPPRSARAAAAPPDTASALTPRSARAAAACVELPPVPPNVGSTPTPRSARAAALGPRRPTTPEGDGSSATPRAMTPTRSGKQGPNLRESADDLQRPPTPPDLGTSALPASLPGTPQTPPRSPRGAGVQTEQMITPRSCRSMSQFITPRSIRNSLTSSNVVAKACDQPKAVGVTTASPIVLLPQAPPAAPPPVAAPSGSPDVLDPSPPAALICLRSAGHVPGCTGVGPPDLPPAPPCLPMTALPPPPLPPAASSSEPTSLLELATGNVASGAPIGWSQASSPLPSTPRLVAPQVAPRKARPVVPRLDLSRVTRIIDGASVGPPVPPATHATAAAASASGGGTGAVTPGSSGSSAASRGGCAREGKASPGSPGTPRCVEPGVGGHVAECFYIGSEGGTVSASSKASTTTSLWIRGTGAAAQITGYAVGKHRPEVDAPSALVGGDLEAPELSYSQYVVDHQRRTVLDAVHCGPLREGQRRLLLAGLVLLQVAIVLFALDPGGIGGSATTAAGSQRLSIAREARFVLAVFAAGAGIATLWYCATIRSSATDEARDLPASTMAPNKDHELVHESANPVSRGRDYAGLLRIMKEEAAKRKEDLQHGALAEVVEPKTPSFAWIADRRRYQHLKDTKNP